ncbi:hypothetical protein [Trichormus azollae]|uniref:hypothetical protein n=1 Tax=Trichormus azollae TaxID=1164 RepID=UPI00325D877B
MHSRQAARPLRLPELVLTLGDVGAVATCEPLPLPPLSGSPDYLDNATEFPPLPEEA